VYQNSERGIPALGLRIKCLNKTFTTMCSKTQMQALNQLTIEIEPDELMGVLGHNGAGKTTLINILTGVLHPD
jgi:ABC-type multidrug transport system ATPase subunit